MISASAWDVTLLDFASVTIWLRAPPAPVSEPCTAVIGAIATSSWFWRPWLPFDWSTPTTWNWTPLRAIVSPSGLALPNRFSTTVGPRSTTGAWFWTSSWVIARPAATW